MSETSVYIFETEGGLKIGIAADVAKRLKAVQAHSPGTVGIFHARTFSSRAEARRVERDLHDRFARHRLHGEWFILNPASVAAALDRRADAAGAAGTALRSSRGAWVEALRL